MYTPSIITATPPVCPGGIPNILWGAIGKSLPTELTIPESLLGYAQKIMRKPTMVQRIQDEFRISKLKLDGAKFTWKLGDFWNREVTCRSLDEDREWQAQAA